MLGQLESDDGIVMADFEAGLGTISRMKASQLDVLLVVFEPTVKSLEIARRALEMIRERSLGRALVVANRVAGEEDRAFVQRAFPEGNAVIVPDDPTIRAADARGLAPFDAAPDAPAVRAVRDLVASLVG